MNPDKKEKPSPFEQARINIKEFASNANLLFSTWMLAEAAATLNALPDDDKSDLVKMCDSTLLDLSKFIEEKGEKWN
tara:strand:+ start:543 stop:773 length:231 start_codon:yes stop_codon:yes gene_type:complete